MAITTIDTTSSARAGGVTTRRRFLGLGLATGLLALGLLGGASFADAGAGAATVGTERAGVRVGTAPGSRESTIDGAHAAPAIAGLERAGTRMASHPSSLPST